MTAYSFPAPPDKVGEVPQDPIWRLSVAQYHEMIRSGILTEADPVELLEGWLITKMPKNPPHTLATQLSRDTLAAALPNGWFINVQEPITTDDSEPEPDLAIIRGTRRDYMERHPKPEEIALVIEVADTTLQRDRALKQHLYARAGIPVYWILNLQERILEYYAQPSGTGEDATYQQSAHYGLTETVPLVISGNEIARIAVRDLIG